MLPVPRRSFPVDPNEYPFADHWFAYGGGYVHYVDEGHGVPVLMLHGNPTWSYLYRRVIRELKSECRLIAPDYPGFGHSRAPPSYGFTPPEQAAAIGALIRHLDLGSFVLAIHDWGGPIGLHYAAEHSRNIRGVLIMNSWAWEASIILKLFSLAMGGLPLGYWLQTRRNFFVDTLLPHGIWHKDKLTPDLLEAYSRPYPSPASRYPTWVFPRHIRKSGSWLRGIESRLSCLSHVPAQILWGRRDKPAFGPAQMRRWQRHFPLHETEVLDDAAHFVQEDRPDRVVAAIRRILNRTAGSAGDSS